jgi:hypothetical protein
MISRTAGCAGHDMPAAASSMSGSTSIVPQFINGSMSHVHYIFHKQKEEIKWKAK